MTMSLSTGVTRYRDVLDNADLRRMLAAFTVVEFGAWSYSIVLAVWIFGSTGSLSGIAALAVVRCVVGMVVTSFAGVIVDRYERRQLLVVCSFLLAAVMVGMTIAVGLGAPLWVILIFSALNATFQSPNRSAAGALLPEVVTESDLVSANVLINLLQNIVIIAGPLLGGLLILLGDPVLGVGLNALTYGIAGLLYSRMTVRSHDAADEAGEPVWIQWRTGIQALASRPYAIALTLCMVISTALDAGYTVVFVEFTQHLDLGDSGYSLFFAATAVGGVLVALVADQVAERAKLGAVIAGCLMLQGFPLVLMGFSERLPVILLMLALSGAGTVLLDVVAMTALQRTMPNRLLGRTLSTIMALLLLAATLTAVGLTRGIQVAGLQETIIVSGMVAPILGLLLVPMLRRGDVQETEDVRALRDRTDFIASLDLFDGMGRPALESLALAAEPVTLPAGAVLLQEGDPADDLWLLQSGRLEVSLRDRLAQPPPVVAPGWVGELGLMNGAPRSATVTVGEESRLLRVSGQQFLDAMTLAAPSPSLVQLAADRTTWKSRTQPSQDAPDVSVLPAG
jgi:MFS family permease